MLVPSTAMPVINMATDVLSMTAEHITALGMPTKTHDQQKSAVNNPVIFKHFISFRLSIRFLLDFFSPAEVVTSRGSVV